MWQPDDAMWRRFLEDSEAAIRETAPKEPSAWERADGAETPPARPAGEGRQAPVGELWVRAEPPPLLPWRDLDGRARCLRLCRLAGVAAVLVVVLATVGRDPAAPGVPSPVPGGVTLQQSEGDPEVEPSVTATVAPPPVRTAMPTRRTEGP